MVWQEFTECCNTAVWKSNLRIEIAWINLHHQLAATSAWSHNSLVANGHDQVDLRLATFDHFGNCGVLGAETDPATHVQANARIHATGL